MGKRESIGLLFSYNENWIGGSYYILNIIETLNCLEDKNKPNLYILCAKQSDFEIVKKLNYPYINLILVDRKPLPKILKWVNNCFYKVFKFYLFKKKNQFKDIKIIFPSTFEPIFNGIPKRIFWIPDFQEKYLPHLFQENELKQREEWQTKIGNEKFAIFSSKNALSDFNIFFPNAKNQKFVFNFCSILPEIKVTLEDVFIKYNLPNTKYFFSPNQFWEHKNHIVILHALTKMKESNTLDFQVYFSGKEADYRNPNYFKSLKLYVEENGLMNNVKFLGFIDRMDQLCLINNAIGIIQPSLFEGWSTVVEDSKALNQNIIVSNLDVHREQLKEKAFYFDPKNENELTTQINIVKNLNKKIFDFNYEYAIKESAENFMSIIKKVKGNEL